MRTIALVMAGMLAAFSALACHQYAPLDTAGLRYRASLDLQCREVTPYPAGTRTHLVRGCGQEAVYVWQCQVVSNNYGSHEPDCTWLLNGGPRPAPR